MPRPRDQYRIEGCRHRVTSAPGVEVLKEQKVGKYTVQVYPYIDGELVYRVLVTVEGWVYQILMASRHDEAIFPAQAAKVGNQMVEELNRERRSVLIPHETPQFDTHKVKIKRSREHHDKVTPNDGKGNALLSAWSDNHRLDEGGEQYGGNNKDEERREGNEQGPSGEHDTGCPGAQRDRR